MSFTYGFYNSKGGDRKYNAEQMSSIFDGIINDGIFANVGRVFATIPGEGLQIVVGSGRAWFNSTWSYNDAAFPIALDPADPIQSRIDSVILEVDRTETVRRNRLLVLTGSPSSSPNPPVLKNTDLVHQHRLANITVTKDAKSINASNITNLVGTEECPFVTGILQTASIEDLFLSWNEQFTNWFEKVQSQLSGDVAGALLLEINQRLHKVDDKASSADMATLTDDTKWVSPAGLKPVLSDFVTESDIRKRISQIGLFTNSTVFYQNDYDQNGNATTGDLIAVISPDLYLIKNKKDNKTQLTLVNGKREMLDRYNTNISWGGMISIYSDSHVILYTDDSYMFVLFVENGRFTNAGTMNYEYGLKNANPTAFFRTTAAIGDTLYTTKYISGSTPYERNFYININLNTKTLDRFAWSDTILKNIQTAIGFGGDYVADFKSTSKSYKISAILSNDVKGASSISYHPVYYVTHQGTYDPHQQECAHFVTIDFASNTVTAFDPPDLEGLQTPTPPVVRFEGFWRFQWAVETDKYFAIFTSIKYAIGDPVTSVPITSPMLLIYTHSGKYICRLSIPVTNPFFLDYMNNLYLYNYSSNGSHTYPTGTAVINLNDPIGESESADGLVGLLRNSYTTLYDEYRLSNNLAYLDYVPSTESISVTMRGITNARAFGSLYKHISNTMRYSYENVYLSFKGCSVPIYINPILDILPLNARNLYNITYVLIEKLSPLFEISDSFPYERGVT